MASFGDPASADGVGREDVARGGRMADHIDDDRLRSIVVGKWPCLPRFGAVRSSMAYARKK